MKIAELIKRNIINVAGGGMAFLIIVNVILIIYNSQIIERAASTTLKNERVKNLFDVLWSDGIRNIDLGLRGYVVTKDEKMLFPFKEATLMYKVHMDSLQKEVNELGEADVKALNTIRENYDKYMVYADSLLVIVKNDSIEEFKAELKKDKGYDLWVLFDKNSAIIKQHLQLLDHQAQDDYQLANTRIIMLQVLLAILGLPTIAFMVLQIRKDREKRSKLFVKLEQNNREYLFNPGTSLDGVDEDLMINNSIGNLKNAARFVSQISKGNYEIDWEQISDANRSLNETNLAGELIQMREKMKKLKAEDERRIWAANGLAELSEVIRNHQNDLKRLCDEVIVFMVKYLNAVQGGLFLVKDDEEDEKFIELTSCYAFNRKKFLQKRIDIGEGIVGQIYLEKESWVLNEVPDNYISIASGLGEKKPNSLVVVPLKYNDTVEGLVEIASFETIEPYKIQFLEKVGDIVASTLQSVTINDKTKSLLDQFKKQTELLKAREEELQQNMEEMQATQEAVRRSEKELGSEI